MNAVLCIVLFSVISSANCRRVVIANAWTHGFDGHINFTPTTNLNGWRIHVKFSQRISNLKVWSVAHIISVSPDKKEFVLQYNKGFKHLRAGHNVRIGFNAQTPSKTTPTAAFYITEGNSNAGITSSTSTSLTGTTSWTSTTFLTTTFPTFSTTCMKSSTSKTCTTSTTPTPGSTSTISTTATTTRTTTTLAANINNQCIDVSFINCKDVQVCKDAILKTYCPVTCGLCVTTTRTTTLSTLMKNQCTDVSFINCKDVHVCEDSRLKSFCPVTCGLCERLTR